MKILILNWRDIKNPAWGGAEIFTHEIARRLAANGHEVTVFAAAFPGCRGEEEIEGYRVVRRGGKHTIYLHAALGYFTRFRGNVDLVVDEINGIPFFTPLYVSERKVFVVFHIVGRIWFLEFARPFADVLFRLEKAALWLYRGIPTIAISQSTKKDLLGSGMRDVRVLRLGVNTPRLERPARKEPFLFVFVGRLKKAKRPDHCVLAMEIFCRKFPKARLKIIGTGDVAVEAQLRRLVAEKGLGGNVELLGHIPEKDKNRIVASAQAILVPSVREGWGLIVTEANAVGTPAIGYDVNGLRDSITNGVNGFLVPDGSAQGIAKAMEKAMEKSNTMPVSSIRASRAYSWDSCAESFEKIPD